MPRPVTPRIRKLIANLIKRADGWEVLEIREDGARFERNGRRVIASYNEEDDGQVWLHVSVSREDRGLPNYTDLCTAHRDFIGQDEYAYQVFAPRAVHVNLAPNVLHLWHCCDGVPLPEFSGVVEGVRTI